MRWPTRGVLLLILAAACPSTPTPVPDAGPDAGGCPPPCTPPLVGPLCVDLDGGSCGADASCCPGLYCSDAGSCFLPPNPCPNGERPRASGCACSPTAGDAGGCVRGYACLPDLHCHVVDAGDQSCGIQTCDPNSETPKCVDPSSFTCGCTTSLPNGLADSCYRIGEICNLTTAHCRPPTIGEPCDPDPTDGGCPTTPFNQQHMDCLADPSGAHLYICTATCATNADCGNGWQFCSRPDGGGGHCVDNSCDRLFSPCSLHLTGPTTGNTLGLCLPFGVLQTNPDATKHAVGFGLCLEASSTTGSTGVACDPDFRRSDGGGIGPPGGPGSFCNLLNVCAPYGACAPACNLTDGKPCQNGSPRCRTLDAPPLPTPFVVARDPDSGVQVGSGFCPP